MRLNDFARGDTGGGDVDDDLPECECLRCLTSRLMEFCEFSWF